MDKEIKLDKYINFERPEGYIPMGHLSTEAEIKEICDKKRILVGEIIKFEGYRVICSKPIKNKKTYQNAKEILDKDYKNKDKQIAIHTSLLT